MAQLLNIPPSKTLLRRHLATHFNLLIGAEAQHQKRDAMELPDYVLLTATAKVKVSSSSHHLIIGYTKNENKGSVLWSGYPIFWGLLSFVDGLKVCASLTIINKIQFWRFSSGGIFAKIIYFIRINNSKQHDVGFYNGYIAKTESPWHGPKYWFQLSYFCCG